HLEGAPVRTFFDNWMDPHGLFKVNRPEVELEQTQMYKVKQYFPKIWFKNNAPSPLLYNWVNIRGIETASPHLKEARKEWIQPLTEFSSPSSIKVATSRLKKIYQPIIGHSAQIEVIPSPFKVWEKEWDNKKIKDGQINLFIMAGDAQNKFSLENTGTLTETSLKKYNQFYGSLINSLELFVKGLKKRKVFQNSVIIITSDRARIVTNSTKPFETTTLWQGLNFSLLSGALTGPLNIGHIQKSHPKYAESLPGTWGLALDSFEVKQFHLLLKELVDAPMFIRPNGKHAKNPWISPKILQNLGVKPNPGRVF
ncbi:MAG: hypothetical protein NXH75_03725, partial [Halobacteriovoraceae bacterium]|nr:hypothetical protein [Halobacteriovoraceae bacterium]